MVQGYKFRINMVQVYRYAIIKLYIVQGYRYTIYGPGIQVYRYTIYKLYIV